MSKLKKPCKNCPMRKDQLEAEWTQCQLDNLSDCDKQTFSQMACHKSKLGKETHCIGWVISQLQNGVQNIGLRLSIAQKAINPNDYDLSFEVHESINKAFQNKILEKEDKYA